MNSKVNILLFFCTMLFLANCKMSKINVGTFQSINNYATESITLFEDYTYLMNISTHMSRQEGKGKWHKKGEYIILESEYKKDDIELIYLPEKSKTNDASESVINIISQYKGSYYDLIDCSIKINDTITTYPKRKLIKSEKYKTIKVFINGLKSKNIPLEFGGDTLNFFLDIPEGDVRFYPFFENQKCVIEKDSFKILYEDNNIAPLVLIRKEE